MILIHNKGTIRLVIAVIPTQNTNEELTKFVLDLVLTTEAITG